MKITKTEIICKEFTEKISAAESKYHVVDEMKKRRSSSIDHYDMKVYKNIFETTHAEK